MNILITGGAGFIGSSLSKHLINSGHSISVIDNLTTGSYSNIKDLVHNNTNFKFYHFTIGIDKNPLLDELVRECDVVVHLAATVGVKNVIENCYHTIINNIAATEEVLEYCKLYRKKCFIASTSEVYGKNTNVLAETDDITFGSPYKNRWSYAVSKLIDEFLALDLYKKYDLPLSIFRFFNVSGPGQVSEYGMVIPKFINQMLNDKDITIFGDGKQTRCFTHILDVCDIIEKVITGKTKESPFGKIINIGSPQEVSILELATFIKMLQHNKSILCFNQEKIAYSNDFEDMQRRFPDVSNLFKILGSEYKFIDWKETVSDAYFWKVNKNGNSNNRI